MSDKKEPAEESRAKEPVPLTGPDRTLLGDYPVQKKDIRPAADIAGETWGVDIDTYPTRRPEEDPPWAIRTVWIWIGFAIFCIGFIYSLLILGAFYD